VADVAFDRAVALGPDLPRTMPAQIVDCAGAARDARAGRPAHPCLLGRHAARGRCRAAGGGRPAPRPMSMPAAPGRATSSASAAHVIEPAAARGGPRILAFLNVSFGGSSGSRARLMVGECADIRLCDARGGGLRAGSCRPVVGMKVRSGRIAGGSERDRARRGGARGGRGAGPAADDPSGRAAAGRATRPRADAPGRHPDPLLPAVPERPGGGADGSARTCTRPARAGSSSTSATAWDRSTSRWRARCWPRASRPT
jgi:hypothetical protein